MQHASSPQSTSLVIQISLFANVFAADLFSDILAAEAVVNNILGSVLQPSHRDQPQYRQVQTIAKARSSVLLQLWQGYVCFDVLMNIAA